MSKAMIKKIAGMSDEEFEKFVVTDISPVKNKYSTPGVYVVFPQDLRAGLDDKLNLASIGKRWTVFINQAGTLAHAVCPESDMLIRLVFGYPLKHLTTERQRLSVVTRLEPFVKL